MMDDSFSFESVKLNAGSDPTKAATLKEEDDDGVLGKRHRNSNGDASHDVKAPTQHPQPSKKPKVEDPVAKAERRRILEEKKRLLADVEKELAKISQKSPSLLSASTSSLPTPKYSASAPTTPMLSSSGPAAPLPAGRGGGVGRGRGRGGGRGGGSKSTPLRSSTTTTAEVIEPEGEPATPVGHVSASSTPLSSASELVATGSRAKRKSPSAAAGIPRRASHDVSTLPTSPTPEGPVTRAKRARRPKRLDNFGGPANLSWALRQCQVLLKTLMTHKFGWPFNQPVDPIALNIPDYFDVIKHPMDLGTIKEQLDSGNYETEEEFADDVRLVFTNTFTYNQPGSDIVVMASTLSSLFSEKFEILKAKIEERGRDAPSEDWVSELRDTASSVQREFERIKRTPNGRGRVGAAEDQRPMTFEEKKKLSHAINNLPSENLGMVVKIIHERMPQLTASGEEIEIDIDALNPATLRHLERYVRSVTQRAGRRRGSRTPSLTGSSKNVQNAEPLAPPPQGTQQKIEDVERQIKALTEHQQALTQKGLARSGETDLLLAAAEEKKKKRNNDDSDSSESETDGSDSSESSDSETSDSESDSGSDSESTDSEAEKQDAAAAASAAAAAATVPPQAMTKVAGDASGAAAAAASSDDTTTATGEASSSSETAGDVSTTASVAGEVTAASAPLPAIEPATASAEADDGTRQENGQNNKVGSAISFSFDPSLGTKESSILPAEVGNGDESLPQAAVAVDDAPPKTEAPKQVALKNVDAWSELSDDFEAPTGKPQSPPSLDKTWSQFQTKKMQDAIREKERLEKEERERKERERREEERRLEEERRRREHEEAEERRRREAEEAELNAQRERERQRQAERLARERGELSMMEQSLLMASFEQQAPPALPLFQYKSLDDVEADFDLDAQPTMDGEGLGKGVDVGRGRSYEGGSDDRDGEATEPEEGAEMELSPTAPLPVPASDEMEEGQI